MPRAKSVIDSKEKGRQKRMGDFFSKCVTKSNTNTTEEKDSVTKTKTCTQPGKSDPQVLLKTKKEKTTVPEEEKKGAVSPKKGSLKIDSNNSSEKETYKKGKGQLISSKSEPKSKKNTDKKTEEKKESDLAKGGTSKRKRTGEKMFSYSWTRQAQRDTEDYRNGYPGKTDYPDQDLNYRFYTNEIESSPDGDFIDNIHADWWGKYKKLERHHGYIQWLFPIRERGLNWEAQELQLHEIEKLNKDPKARKRILTSYKMMLDFYGMKLDDDKDGTIVRADNWEDRFYELNRSFHNYLRITRILKCLGEFGYENLKANFVKFVLHEGLVEETLPNLIESCMKYWVGVLKNDDERKAMFDYYEELSGEPEDEMPSPKSSKQEAKTGSHRGEKTETVNHYDNDLSDEDGALGYAMNLIDDPKDDSQVKSKRKGHELSDEEEMGEESQESKFGNAGNGSDSVTEDGTVEEKSKINVAKDEVDGDVVNKHVSNAGNTKAEVEVVTGCDESKLIDKDRKHETHSENSNETKLKGKVQTSDVHVTMANSDTLENKNNSEDTGAETDTCISVKDITSSANQGNSEIEFMEEETAKKDNSSDTGAETDTCVSVKDITSSANQGNSEIEFMEEETAKKDNSSDAGAETDTCVSVKDITSSANQGNSEIELMEEETAKKDNSSQATDTA